MDISAIGTSHRLAPVSIRERVLVRPGALGDVLAEVTPPDGEAMVLSTCNRTEVYFVATDPEATEVVVRRTLESLAGVAGGDLDGILYTRRGGAAALHLCRVAAGLDSLVPGEPQILGQTRDAYETARRAGATGTMLNQLCRQALRAGKRVRAETGLGQRPASVPDAAAALAARVFGDLAQRSVLLVGAGEVGTLVGRALRDRGADVVVANRGAAAAAELASRLDGMATSLDELEPALAEADVVIASTSADRYILDAGQVAGVLGSRAGRPLFLIDLAVPRDLDPEINDLPDCYLYGIDDLEAVVADAAAEHAEAAVVAEEIVRAEARAFAAWRNERDVVPAIRRLRRRAEEIRSGELSRAAGRLEDLTPRERRAVEAMSAQIVNKLLHVPIVRLKEAAAGAEGGEYADTVRHLFGLDD